MNAPLPAAPATGMPAACPASDVSSGVGLSGLAGLFLWVAVCRYWPEIAGMLGLPGSHAPLSGPYVALATVLFSGIPMVAWSLLVDKVHTRASTGIDWSSPRPLSAIVDVSITKLAGLWATWAIIAAVYCIARWYWRGAALFAMEVFTIGAVPLFLLSIPYVLWLDRVLVNPRDGAWHFGAMLIGREPFDRDEVFAHLRAWTVKGFFCAFMVSILPGGFNAMVTLDLAGVPFEPVSVARWLTELLFVIDVHIAMVGYLLTMKPLDSHIRSANPYLAGWVAALICYPPFILMGDNGPLAYHQNTADWAYWMQGHTGLMWAWAALLVFLTGVYAWATVIFGIRFSNLTYRGVITNGPYRFTRHPAYLSKNLFWWASVLPFLATNGNPVDMVRNTVTLGLVSAVYYWRARTEEKHLLAEDAKYGEYHAWMGHNAAITRGLARIAALFQPRGPQSQPAE